MYRLVETIRIEDGEPAFPGDHQRRAERSLMQLCGGRAAACCRIPEIGAELCVPKPFRRGLVKCRFLYAPPLSDCADVAAGSIPAYRFEFFAYRPRPVAALRLIDGSPDYALKYADRSGLDALREAAFGGELSEGGRSGLDRGAEDILIIRGGLVTDTSFTNIVFMRDGKWYTPAAPLLNGTERERLLRAGTVIEADIAEAEIPKFDGFRLINAMLPFARQPILDTGVIYR